jgi:nicotinamidase-related amidase
MSDNLDLDPKISALLVMDFQTIVVGGPAVPGSAADKDALLARTASVIDRARKAGMMVIYVVVGFRVACLELSPRNKTFVAARARLFVEGAAGSEIHPAVAPRAGEVVVTKHRVSAFAGTDLDMILRANGIETMVLAGIATSGVVLSTVRHAADADYRVVVIADCCSDPDPEVHRILLEKVFQRQTTVVNADEVVGALALGGRPPSSAA